MACVVLFALTVLIGHANCINKVLFNKEDGLYLKGSMIRKVHAKDQFECIVFCSKEPLCVSVNYKKSGEDQGRCELNNKTLKESPHQGCLKTPEYSYLERAEQQCKQSQRAAYHKDVLSLNSLILEGKQEYLRNLTKWLNGQTNWQLCYRASKDGWEANKFHALCDQKGPTVTIVRVNNYIFGGYASVSWGGTPVATDHECGTCFLFSFKNKEDLPPFTAPVYQAKGEAIKNDPNSGPAFGKDLVISDRPNLGYGSQTDFGNSYKPPNGYTYGDSRARVLFAGRFQFNVNEVEVFYVGHE